MMYRDAPEYAEIGEKVIKKVKELRFLEDADCRIGYLASAKEKENHKKPVYGECKKVDEIWKVFCPYDFLIIIYEKNCSTLGIRKTRTGIRYIPSIPMTTESSTRSRGSTGTTGAGGSDEDRRHIRHGKDRL